MTQEVPEARSRMMVRYPAAAVIAVVRARSFGTFRLPCLQRPRDLGALVALDLIADLHVVVVAHADAALGAGAHFRDVVLEPPQRLELTLVDHDVVAQHPNR